MSEDRRPRWVGGVIVVIVAGAAVASFALSRPGPEPAPRPIAASLQGEALAEVTVYKSPDCICCARWVDHVRREGFAVRTVEMADLSEVKSRNGIGPELAACHTATVDGYVIEGHVPADLIARLLEERPEVAGLAVPGMPMGSPGMEGPRQDRYDVLAFDGEGRARVYASR